MKFGLQRVSIWVNIQKKFQVPRSHSIGEKCDANFKLSSHFSRKVCDLWTWNLVCKKYPYGLIHKKFSSSSVAQYRRKMRCYLVKFQSCLLGQLCNFEFLQVIIAFFSKVCDRETWNLVCKEYPYGLIYKKNFKFLGRTVSEKNAMLICKISKLFIRTIVQLWIFASYHRIFSRKVCDRGTWNLVCKEYPYGLIYKKNFKFLGRTVSEKSAMLISSYHRIFLEKCATEEHEIWFAKSIHMG